MKTATVAIRPIYHEYAVSGIGIHILVYILFPKFMPLPITFRTSNETSKQFPNVPPMIPNGIPSGDSETGILVSGKMSCSCSHLSGCRMLLSEISPIILVCIAWLARRRRLGPAQECCWRRLKGVAPATCYQRTRNPRGFCNNQSMGWNSNSCLVSPELCY